MNWIYQLSIGIAVALFYDGFSPKSQDVNLAIIGNAKGVPAEMNINQLKSTMKGEKLRWPDGSKVVIALMKTNTSIGQNTSKKIYNMSSDELNKYWLALVFQGKADAPNFFNSESELEEFVAQTKGSIGVVNQVSPTNRAILIDGKKFL
ncbi:hypothetical protein [Spirosoma endophyticum]|uniref:PBP domain-containing protein n=1 Tax=Spirosoma endophyticum TaxID=662367 RepID=A0A1I1IPW6_9BACT|nr:hypothetical protein [Spirosoma endophyticum]SFC35793.1 hypothetical protein SAMN05216167_101947 [Spirosoma endophyticum]